MKHLLELQALRGGSPGRDEANSTPTMILSTVSLTACISGRLSSALRTP